MSAPQKALFFLLLFGGGLLVLDRTGAWVLDRVHEHTRAGQKGGRVITYLALPAPPPVLLMGNSCMGCNVNPDSLHLEAYSLTHDGTRQIFQTGLLSLLAQRGQLPRAIVLSIDLREYMAPSYREDITNLKYYYGQAPYITQYHQELSRWEPLKFWFSLYRHNNRLFGLANNWRWVPPPLNQGFEPTGPTAADSARAAYSAARLAREVGPLNRGALRYLQDFVRLCQSRRVRLVCVTAPYYRAPPWLPAASAVVDSLLRTASVPYLNMALHPVVRLDGQHRYWHDEVHLNTRGVPWLSQALARQLGGLLGPSAAPANQPTSKTALCAARCFPAKQ